MNEIKDEVYAEALVKAGIIEAHTRSISGVRVYRIKETIQYHSESTIITDWRVAGKVLELAHMAFIEKHSRWQVRYDKAYGHRNREWHSGESLPRAIIEAWYQATKQEGEGCSTSTTFGN